MPPGLATLVGPVGPLIALAALALLALEWLRRSRRVTGRTGMVLTGVAVLLGAFILLHNIALFLQRPETGLAVLAVALSVSGIAWVRRSGLTTMDRGLAGGALALVALVGAFVIGVNGRGFPWPSVLALAAVLWVLRGMLVRKAVAVGVLGVATLFGAFGLVVFAVEGDDAAAVFAALGVLAAVALFRMWRGGDVRRPEWVPDPGGAPDTGRAPTNPGAGVRGEGWRPTAGAASGSSPEATAGGRESAGRPRDATPGVIRGEVRNFRERQEKRKGSGGRDETEIVWTFRVERYREGHRLPPVAVEMRGESLGGSIGDGDTVEVPLRGSPGRTLTPTRVYNVTTGAVAEVKGGGLLQRLGRLFERSPAPATGARTEADPPREADPRPEPDPRSGSGGRPQPGAGSRGKRVISGVVRDFRPTRGQSIWVFRLERYEQGHRLPPVGVEMRGYPFSGHIADGHTVEVRAPRGWMEGAVIRTRRAYNRTLNMPIRGRRDLSLVVPAVIIIALIVALALAAG